MIVGPMTIGIVGAGTMGAGIAQLCIVAGHAVRLHDASEAALDAGRERIDAGLERLVEKGRLTEAARDSARQRLSLAQDPGVVASGADVVVEAAIEDMAVKRAIFELLDRTAPLQAILATNTSALSVTTIAAATAHPERVLGLHFFNPAPVMALVEVVAGERSSTPVVEAAIAFTEGLGKRAIPCHDAPGFIVNRVNRPFTIEALRMLEGAEADIAAIDAAMVAAGYPMGPFALIDLVGVDVNLAVAQTLFVGFGDAERFRPSPIQAQLVAAGELGRKTGSGFYRYDQAGSATGPAPRFTARSDDAIDAGTIRSRIELATINEAYRAAGDGVASPPDIDLALTLGAGHPVGPFARARDIGLGHVVAQLRELEEQHGERFRVAPSLWQVASI
jgi:3-hydroxybutyryl-CoA dehydrogenase